MERHIKRHKCPDLSCPYASEGFGSKNTRDRHVGTKHPGEFSETQRFFCPVISCNSSEARGMGKPRKDLLERHKKSHKELEGKEGLNGF